MISTPRYPRAASRETSSGRFLPEIDGLLFIAISLVVLYHAAFHDCDRAPAAFVAVSADGYFGVYLFFAISGFILGLPFAQHLLLDEPEVFTIVRGFLDSAGKARGL